MIKKHFIAIAAGFKRQLLQATKEAETRPELLSSCLAIRNCAAMFADVAASENPRFDRTRFLSACGF